jgi:hypothetical protein
VKLDLGVAQDGSSSSREQKASNNSNHLHLSSSSSKWRVLGVVPVVEMYLYLLE